MNLYQASRCYFTLSQKALKRSLYIGALLLVLTLVTLIPSSSVEDAVLIVLIGSLQLWQMWSKYKALVLLGKADQPRRMHQLEYGLGIKPSPIRCAEIEGEIGACEEPADPHYWLSRKPQGAKRMIEMILESSFYTKSLAAQCRAQFRGIGLAGLAVTIIALVVAIRVHSKEPNELVAHIVLTILVFFLTGDFWTLSFLYDDLYQAADDSHKRAFELLKKPDNSYDEALEAALDYNTAVVQAPPLLSSKHEKSKDNLDRIFKRNYGSLMGLEDTV
jgi:hypothetical protein